MIEMLFVAIIAIAGGVGAIFFIGKYEGERAKVKKLTGELGLIKNMKGDQIVLLKQLELMDEAEHVLEHEKVVLKKQIKALKKELAAKETTINLVVREG